MRYYKDRDFHEVKTSNSDIVAVIENLDQLNRVIKEHNDLEDLLDMHRSRSGQLLVENEKLSSQVQQLKKESEHNFSRAERWKEEALKQQEMCNLPPKDVCCCGDSMENHPNPMDCGHSAVSMFDHHMSSVENEAEKRGFERAVRILKSEEAQKEMERHDSTFIFHKGPVGWAKWLESKKPE